MCRYGSAPMPSSTFTAGIKLLPAALAAFMVSLQLQQQAQRICQVHSMYISGAVILPACAWRQDSCQQRPAAIWSCWARPTIWVPQCNSLAPTAVTSCYLTASLCCCSLTGQYSSRHALLLTGCVASAPCICTPCLCTCPALLHCTLLHPAPHTSPPTPTLAPFHWPSAHSQLSSSCAQFEARQ